MARYSAVHAEMIVLKDVSVGKVAFMAWWVLSTAASGLVVSLFPVVYGPYS